MKDGIQTIRGNIIGGLGAATRLGFPTANISRSEYHRSKLKLPLGVYAGVTTLLDSGKRFKAGIVVGPNKIEAHLLGFSGKLYGKRVAFTFVKRLRAMKVFADETLLKRQIQSDLKRVERIVDISKMA